MLGLILTGLAAAAAVIVGTRPRPEPKPVPVRVKSKSGPAPRLSMIVTTTHSVEGRPIAAYHGVVVGEVIMGANIVRDLFAGITDIVGGRSGAYEQKLDEARREAMREIEERAAALGANAVVGVDIDYEVVGNSMLMVSVSGTAVSVKES